MTLFNIGSQGYAPYANTLIEKKVFVFCDINTYPYSKPLIDSFHQKQIMFQLFIFPDKDLIPTIDYCQSLIENAKSYDYLIAIGSGSLNDMGKYVANALEIPYGIIATAPSMDGYLSVGSALMNKGVKITYSVKMPNDMIVDLAILKKAPQSMIASGFGDIIGKYTSLADWRLSHILKDEVIHQESYEMMEKALIDTIDAYESIREKQDLGIGLLMNALLIAGTSMALCTTSRPASGSEHHISHYLEMDFVKNKKIVPLHGFKVALGSMIMLDLYHSIDFGKIEPSKHKWIQELVQSLPTSDFVKELLHNIGAPVRFSTIGVDRTLLRKTLLNAYQVRDRFTLLTWLSNNLDYPKQVDLLVEKYQ